MKISDLLAMCARNLTRRKFRTFLTVMGVVIGTSFIVLMISLGIAIDQNNQAMLESWGDLTMITIENYGNTDTPLDDAAIEAINMIPGVDVATATTRLNSEINGSYPMFYAGRKDRYNNGAWGVQCLSSDAIEKMGYQLEEGIMLSQVTGPANPNKPKIRILAGSKFAYEFYDSKKKWPNDYVDYWGIPEGDPLPDPFFDPLTTELVLSIPPQRDTGKELRYEVEIVGILKEDWRIGSETSYGCLMSIDDMLRIKADFEKANNIKKDKEAVKGYDRGRVKCVDIDRVAEVEEAILAMGFPNVYSMEQERQSMQENAQQLQLILGIIGGVALFISALSIMNTMIMSVYERTREIGVMKVLGCVLGNIRAVFLIEAGLIGFCGGVIGDSLSYGLSFLFNRYGGSLSQIMGMGGYYGGEVEQKLSVIPPELLLLGLVFATLVGLVSGIIPAMRAVKISALEAIRTE